MSKYVKHQITILLPLNACILTMHNEYLLWYWTVLDSLGQFWTVLDSKRRFKPSLGHCPSKT